MIENLSKFSWLFRFSSRKNSSHHRFFSILIKSLFINDRTDIIKSIIWESIKKLIISFMISVMKDCWMLILLTIMIALIIRLIISKLAILIIVIFLLLFEFLFDCLHDIYFLNNWIRIHSCFFSDKNSLKFFKFKNVMIISIILDLLHELRSSNIVFEWEFFD